MRTPVAICLSLSLMASVCMFAGAYEDDGSTSFTRSFITYTLRTPFRIDSNDDFPTYANGGGNGSATDPWIIEGYEINGTGKGYCIFISNATAHFVVRDCYLHGTLGGPPVLYLDSGLILNNTRNGTIHNNIATDNGGGIALFLSNNNTISMNNVSRNYHGIFLGSSSGNIIVNNTVSWNEGYGISFNMDLYFSPEPSDHNTIVNNTVSDNWNGMLMAYSNNNSIYGNNLSRNEKYGIDVAYSNDNTLIGNTVSRNMLYGISLQGSSKRNYVYHNELICNAVQASDYCEPCTNNWDDRYPGGGNYWSDYTGVDHNRGPNQFLPSPDGIGDTQYLIPGDGGAFDNYPLMRPWIFDNEPPVANAGQDQTVYAGSIVKFNGTGSMDKVMIRTYTWMFKEEGRNINMDGASPTHQFTAAGQYPITLYVTDSSGNTGNDTMIVTVLIIPPDMIDSDRDGVPDKEDAFPNDAWEWADSDLDGVGNNTDAFPEDPSETKDFDGDGVGDNADAFPNDPDRWKEDEDGDEFDDEGRWVMLIAFVILISTLAILGFLIFKEKGHSGAGQEE